MNHDSSTTWHQTLQDDPMLVAGDDDFTNFLQLGIDFPGFDETPAHHNGFDTPMGDLGMDQLAMDSSLEDIRGHALQNSTSFPERGRGHLMQGYMKIPTGADAITNGSAAHHQQAAQQMKRDAQKAQYGSRVMIPPTPQSSEMQGQAVRYYHYIEADGVAAYDPYQSQQPQQQRDDQITFTPLVSPAVTPVDPSLRFPETTVPREYFSPLSSPAIQAQNESSRRRAPHHVSVPVSSSIVSPVDPATEMPAIPGPARTSTRKDSRKLSFSGKAAARVVRQSPRMKPHARRKQPSLNIPPAGLAELAECRQLAMGSAAELSPNYQGLSATSDGSGQSSISPEPLSDALMPPPILPRSAGKSPNITGKTQSPSTMNEPATPATLMRLPNQESSPQTGGPNPGQMAISNQEFMEDIMLPESVATAHLPPLTIDTSRVVADDQITPTPSAKTPKLSSKSTPRASTMSMQGKSPIDAAHKRTESRSGHANKTRPGAASSHVSPAIRPKISPSIKPLVPHSTPGTPSLSAETSALYLASKSNYQNILEGTHLPGVSYPEALAENLSSKRTSHKLAEQGRRNRINVALKEMEALLPPTPTVKGKRDRSGSIDGDLGDKSAASNNSKASTVEMAIAYIRALQAELTETKAKLEDREKQLAEASSSGDNASQSPQ